MTQGNTPRGYRLRLAVLYGALALFLASLALSLWVGLLRLSRLGAP